MSWLRRAVIRWLNGHSTNTDGPKEVLSLGAASSGPMGYFASPENPQSLNVVSVRNGFLICRRTYNANGPDRIDAVFAAAAEDLGPLLVAEMASMRLTK